MGSPLTPEQQKQQQDRRQQELLAKVREANRQSHHRPR